MTNKAHSAKGVPFEVLMNKSVRENLLVAAEACFEQNPCPRIEKWCDDLSHTTEEKTDNQYSKIKPEMVQHLVQHRTQNALGATLVQHKKHHKTQQNITNHK